ncbi:hypothetical protein Ae406Ps2_1211c [Pseudonocardia sp. Ae406_Ps2]|nr:hypothetical protein Ae406Ps2_1211c [Pseudonocardia sp. Ae406_Ps2]OLM06995.1 hypothetical protein Ae331Ps2_4705 [Pseudonocardia sp. Ae331_Ps2]OLM14188.1 hypothetical protein Ae505Ps2_4318 [Pseudonocardia sp. Ae505_Ps2]OLM22786.1 hypothetical protein Ae706Ps2_1218c [Pseudonocardia sp. Ae706_Ps2]
MVDLVGVCVMTGRLLRGGGGPFPAVCDGQPASARASR